MGAHRCMEGSIEGCTDMHRNVKRGVQRYTEGCRGAQICMEGAWRCCRGAWKCTEGCMEVCVEVHRSVHGGV